MVAQKVAIEKVQNFAKEITSATGLNLRRIILFGSYASGNPNKWSDIDVALVADEFSGIGFDDMAHFAKINNRPPYVDIETRTYNTENFSPDKDPFVEEIIRTGIEIKLSQRDRK